MRTFALSLAQTTFADTVKEVSLPSHQSSHPSSGPGRDTATLLACVATILELPLDELPRPADGEDAATGWTLSRWLGGLGLGLVPVANANTFQWPGPWIARIREAASGERRAVVMYGVPSGVVWDPAHDPGDGSTAPAPLDAIEPDLIEDGFLIAAGDIALAIPPRPQATTSTGVVEEIWVAPDAGAPAQLREQASAIPGKGLEGDRHVVGTGTFPSGLPGSALTLIEAEVCGSFEPPLQADVHRRNVVTRGIDLNRLVGSEFMIGDVRCRGMRLCEPCTVVQRYAGRPILRPLVHRGGLRADILTEGAIRTGDEIRAALSIE